MKTLRGNNVYYTCYIVFAKICVDFDEKKKKKNKKK